MGSGTEAGLQWGIRGPEPAPSSPVWPAAAAHPSLTSPGAPPAGLAAPTSPPLPATSAVPAARFPEPRLLLPRFSAQPCSQRRPTT